MMRQLSFASVGSVRRPVRSMGVLVVALLLAAFGSSDAAQQKQLPPTPGAPKNFTLPAPMRFTLQNGLPVTMVAFGHVPKVSVRLVVEAGNVYETANQVWLADVMGRMLQEGTVALTADALARELAGMGGELSVGVGPDRASIGTDVLSEHGARAVQLVADVARHPQLPGDALARVKASLARDLAIQKTQPQSVAQEKFSAFVYGDHPYGRIFPTDAMLDSYTLDDVRAFHRQHFGANRARLYIAGVFDAAAMEQAVRQAFGDWTASDRTTAAAVTREAHKHFAILDRADAPQSTIFLGLRVPDPSQADWVALQVTDALLGGAFASRITSNIREQKGYTYSPNSSVNSHRRDANWVEVADVTTAVTGPALKEIFAEIDRLRREAPPSDELQGIKNSLAGVFVVQNASRSSLISQLAFVDLHGLGEDYLTKYVERVNAVTAEDVRRIAHDYLTPERMTLVVVGDTKAIKDQLAPWSQGATEQ
jgi:zinc protease